MHSKFLLTVVGEDRPGIVARLTEVLVKHEANLEESRMAILGGEFAAIVLVSAPEARIKDLETDLAGLKSEGITVTVKGTHKPGAERFAGTTNFELTLSGADHEGIVYKVSQLLHDRSINIQSLETDVVHAPETGTPLFEMCATIAVPSSLKVADLEKELNRIGNEENVDITLKPAHAHTGASAVLNV